MDTIRAGQIWRQDDGCLCRVVRVTDEWIWIKQGDDRTKRARKPHPSWFSQFSTQASPGYFAPGWWTLETDVQP